MTKKFEPTQDERALVGKLAGFGLPETMIRHLVRAGIAATTLRRAFARELEEGRARAGAKILATLYQRAINGDITSMIFYIKCRIPGWREIQRTEVTGADGQPLVAPPTGIMLVPTPPTLDAWEKMVTDLTAKQQALAKPKDTLQ